MADIRSFAGRRLPMVRKVGLPLDLDDLIQELSLVWVNANNRYDESRGASFRTYFFAAMHREVNRMITTGYKRHALSAASLDAADDDEQSLYDVLTTDTPGIDISLIEVENCLQVLDMLSERARRFVELLLFPPVELYKVLDARKARFDYARSRGIKSHMTPRSVNTALVFDLLGADHAERVIIFRQIRAAIEKVNQ